MIYGWTGKILRVDLTKRKTTIEDVKPYTESFIGGRGINVKIVYDEVGKDVSPIDPENIVPDDHLSSRFRTGYLRVNY